MNIIEKMKVRRQYKKLVQSVEDMKVYDGRGKGVDVYVCSKCGKVELTRYKDKGVTPFVMRCRSCGGDAMHRTTVSEVEANLMCTADFLTVQNWVRPPLKWLLKQDMGLVEHVLDGGLVLEREVLEDESHIYD